MNDIEQKRQKFETWAKYIGLGVAGLLFAPFAIATIKGVISLLVVFTIGALAFHVGLPWLSASLAVWRLKALKAVAAANPIEQFELRYKERKDALVKQRENIKQRLAIAARIFNQITTFEQQFNKPSPRRKPYDQLVQLVELSKSRYTNAQVALVSYGKLIDEKRADWEIVQSMNEESKLRQVGEDFVSKLMEDTALNTVQNGLDTAFAELDAAVMDENIDKILNGQTVEISATVVSANLAAAKPQKALVAPSSMSDLDFDFDVSTTGGNRQKIAIS